MRAKKYCFLLLACITIMGSVSIPTSAAWIGEQEPENIELRATGKFDFPIPANTMMEASSSFPMEYGETVTITPSYSPASASLDFGLIDSDNVFYSIPASNGSFSRTIRIDQRGTYIFAIRNNSGYEVDVSGFVNY